jgi:prophage regulatory protein
METNQNQQHSFIRLEEVKKRTGLSRSSIYSFMNKQSFPKAIHITARSVAWFEGEVQDWIYRRIELSRK